MTGQNVRHDDGTMVPKAHAMVKFSCQAKQNTATLVVRKHTSRKSQRSHKVKKITF